MPQGNPTTDLTPKEDTAKLIEEVDALLGSLNESPSVEEAQALTRQIEEDNPLSTTITPAVIDYSTIDTSKWNRPKSETDLEEILHYKKYWDTDAEEFPMPEDFPRQPRISDFFTVTSDDEEEIKRLGSQERWMNQLPKERSDQLVTYRQQRAEWEKLLYRVAPWRGVADGGRNRPPFRGEKGLEVSLDAPLEAWRAAIAVRREAFNLYIKNHPRFSKEWDNYTIAQQNHVRNVYYQHLHDEFGIGKEYVAVGARKDYMWLTEPFKGPYTEDIPGFGPGAADLNPFSRIGKSDIPEIKLPLYDEETELMFEAFTKGLFDIDSYNNNSGRALGDNGLDQDQFLVLSELLHQRVHANPNRKDLHAMYREKKQYSDGIERQHKLAAAIAKRARDIRMHIAVEEEGTRREFNLFGRSHKNSDLSEDEMMKWTSWFRSVLPDGTAEFAQEELPSWLGGGEEGPITEELILRHKVANLRKLEGKDFTAWETAGSFTGVLGSYAGAYRALGKAGLTSFWKESLKRKTATLLATSGMEMGLNYMWNRDHYSITSHILYGGEPNAALSMAEAVTIGAAFNLGMEAIIPFKGMRKDRAIARLKKLGVTNSELELLERGAAYDIVGETMTRKQIKEGSKFFSDEMPAFIDNSEAVLNEWKVMADNGISPKRAVDDFYGQTYKHLDGATKKKFEELFYLAAGRKKTWREAISLKKIPKGKADFTADLITEIKKNNLDKAKSVMAAEGPEAFATQRQIELVAAMNKANSRILPGRLRVIVGDEAFESGRVIGGREPVKSRVSPYDPEETENWFKKKKSEEVVRSKVEPEETVDKIPLGVARGPVYDARLRQLPDDAFEAQRSSIKRKLDKMEAEYDEFPNKANEDLEWRKKLASVQDEYEAVELESFRRQIRDMHGESIADELRKLRPQIDSDKAKAVLLIDEVSKRPEAMKQMEGELRAYAERNPDHAEIITDQLGKIKKTADEFKIRNLEAEAHKPAASGVRATAEELAVKIPASESKVELSRLIHESRGAHEALVDIENHFRFLTHEAGLNGEEALTKSYHSILEDSRKLRMSVAEIQDRILAGEKPTGGGRMSVEYAKQLDILREQLRKMQKARANRLRDLRDFYNDELITRDWIKSQIEKGNITVSETDKAAARNIVEEAKSDISKLEELFERGTAGGRFALADMKIEDFMPKGEPYNKVTKEAIDAHAASKRIVTREILKMGKEAGPLALALGFGATVDHFTQDEEEGLALAAMAFTIWPFGRRKRSLRDSGKPPAWSRFAFTTASELEKQSPRFITPMMRYETNVMANSQFYRSYAEETGSFLVNAVESRVITPKEADYLHYLISDRGLTSATLKEAKQLATKWENSPKSFGSLQSADWFIDRLVTMEQMKNDAYALMRRMGRKNFRKITETTDRKHWPRSAKDLEKFREAMAAKMVKDSEDAFKAGKITKDEIWHIDAARAEVHKTYKNQVKEIYENAHRRHHKYKEGEEIDEKTLTKIHNAALTDNTKGVRHADGSLRGQRKIEAIPEEFAEHYHNPFKGWLDYMDVIVRNIERDRLFGYKKMSRQASQRTMGAVFSELQPDALWLKKGGTIKYRSGDQTLPEDITLNEAVPKADRHLLIPGEYKRLKEVGRRNPRRHEITDDQAQRAKWLIENHFIRADTSSWENTFWQIGKGVTHFLNLLQFSTTLTQSGDFGLTALTEGTRVAAKMAGIQTGLEFNKLLNKLFKGKNRPIVSKDIVFLRENMGLNPLGSELFYTGGAGEYVSRTISKLMQYTGLAGYDGFLKNTKMNSTLMNLRKGVKGYVRPDGRVVINNVDPKITKRFKKLFGRNDYDDLLEAVVREDWDNWNLRTAVMIELGRLQPITLLQTSPAYASGGGFVRFCYTLKAFQISYISHLRTAIFGKMAKGAKLLMHNKTRNEGRKLIFEGSGHLVKLAACFGIPTFSVALFKDFLNGRDFDPSAAAYDTMWQVAGIPRGQAWMARRDLQNLGPVKGPIWTGVKAAMPPLAGNLELVVRDIMRIIAGEEWKNLETIRFIPGVGRPAHGWIGAGAQKERKKRAKRLEGAGTRRGGGTRGGEVVTRRGGGR